MSGEADGPRTEGDRVISGNLETYGSSWSLAEYTRDQELWPIEAALIDQVFPKPPALVLDLGCGAGRTTIGLGRRGYRPTGIDLSEPLLSAARRRHPWLDFRLMDARKLEFADASFDAALFSYNGIDCIYPPAERIRCMREVFRVLKPGGVFLLSSLNFIGSIFSGGFHYARGYWNAARRLALQVGNPIAHEWYVRYRDGGGIQHLYSAPPGRTVHQLQSAGFNVVDVRGSTGERRRRAILLHDQVVYFTAVRPL